MDQVKQGTDALFILLGAIMVLAMHAGFAFLELGTVRKKNQVNALVKILVDFAVSTIAYFFVGYTVAYGVHFFTGAEALAADRLGANTCRAGTRCRCSARCLCGLSAALALSGVPWLPRCSALVWRWPRPHPPRPSPPRQRPRLRRREPRPGTRLLPARPPTRRVQPRTRVQGRANGAWQSRNSRWRGQG